MKATRPPHRISFSPAILLATMLVISRCLDPYHIPRSQTPSNGLVVDAFLNATDGILTAKLSRVYAVESYENAPAETNAVVILADEEGTAYPLTEDPPGTYIASGLTFGAGDNVKLKIKTTNESQYESSVVPVLITSAIDSVTWIEKREGLQLHVTTHNDNTNKYYHWRFSETWYHHAKYEVSVTVNEELEFVPVKEYTYSCWTTQSSTDILVGTSSERSAASGVVYKFPLQTIPWDSPKMIRRYSMEVEQRSITPETYEYLTQLRENTEHLGTLFDPLPASPIGNIRCITHPDEAVQGNFSAGSVEKMRIFVNKYSLNYPKDIRPADGNGGCFLVEIRQLNDWHFFEPVWTGSTFMGTTKECVDCRLHGGTNHMPDFWVE